MRDRPKTIDMNGFGTALIDGIKSRAATKRLEKKTLPCVGSFPHEEDHDGQFVVQSAVPFPRRRVLQYFTPEKVDHIVRHSGVSESGWRLRGFHVDRRPGETCAPEEQKAIDGAFLSYFGPFSLPYIAYRDTRDLFADRFGRQSFVTLRFTREKRKGTPGQVGIMSGNPQITFL